MNIGEQAVKDHIDQLRQHKRAWNKDNQRALDEYINHFKKGKNSSLTRAAAEEFKSALIKTNIFAFAFYEPIKSALDNFQEILDLSLQSGLADIPKIAAIQNEIAEANKPSDPAQKHRLRQLIDAKNTLEECLEVRLSSNLIHSGLILSAFQLTTVSLKIRTEFAKKVLNFGLPAKIRGKLSLLKKDIESIGKETLKEDIVSALEHSELAAAVLEEVKTLKALRFLITRLENDTSVGGTEKFLRKLDKLNQMVDDLGRISKIILKLLELANTQYNSRKMFI